MNLPNQPGAVNGETAPLFQLERRAVAVTGLKRSTKAARLTITEATKEMKGSSVLRYRRVLQLNPAVLTFDVLRPSTLSVSSAVKTKRHPPQISRIKRMGRFKQIQWCDCQTNRWSRTAASRPVSEWQMNSDIYSGELSAFTAEVAHLFRYTKRANDRPLE